MNLLEEKLALVEEYLSSHDLKLEDVAGVKKEHFLHLVDTQSSLAKRHLKRLAKFFDVDFALFSEGVSLEEFKKNELAMPSKLFKLRELSKYLLEHEKLELYRALSLSKRKADELLSGKKKISLRLLRRTATYFNLPLHYLTNDEEVLPLSDIKLDSNIVSIQRDDVANEIAKEANKHSFKRNWNVLSHSQRVKLILTSLLIVVPLVGYTAYCAYVLISDRNATQEEFISQQSLTAEEEDIIAKQEALLHEKGQEKYQVDVSIGMSVAYIGNVSNSGYSFAPSVEVFFDFDNEDYFRMIYNYENGTDFDTNNAYLNDPKYQHDDFGYNMATGELFKHADDVPDYMQIEGYSINDMGHEFYCTSYRDFVDTLYTIDNGDGTYAMSDATWDRLDISLFEMSQIYAKVISQYPGETTSNVYPNKDGLFSVGHSAGSFVDNSFSCGYSTPYTLRDEQGNVEYRYFQSVSFSATISKAYNSPRYPLDSVSFNIPITSEKLTYEYLKYVPVDYVDLTEDQIIRNADPNTEGQYTCSIDSNIYSTGTNPGFKISTAYRLINSSDEIDDICRKVVLRYFTNPANEDVASDINDPTKVFYYSEYQLILHANRAGISLFLQAFINLFAVVIWIVIGFYDQTYHSESAIGMLGTGLFGAISSILVGLSMISEAGIFSLITMINVFTLGVILIMTFASINAKRAKITGNKMAMAYNQVFLRILFLTLVFCTVMMFLGLPLSSYIFY